MARGSTVDQEACARADGARRARTAAVIVAAMVANSPAATSCDRAASPSGSDSAAGSVASPYRTAQKLVDSLAPGQTGCLRAGTYEENVTISRAAAPASPVTLSSYPGERATVRGRFRVKDSANFVTVESLDLDGRNARQPAEPERHGDDVTFSGQRRHQLSLHGDLLHARLERPTGARFAR